MSIIRAGSTSKSPTNTSPSAFAQSNVTIRDPARKPSLRASTIGLASPAEARVSDRPRAAAPGAVAGAGAGAEDNPPHPQSTITTATNTPSSMTMSQRWMKAAQTLAVVRHLSTLSAFPDTAVTLLEASLFQLFLESIAISSPEGPAQMVADLQHPDSRISA